MTRQSIFLDTNILSIFAELNKLDLLLTVLGQHSLHISPTIYKELSVGLTKGHSFLQSVLDSIGENQPITVTVLTEKETKSLEALPTWLASGEAECIVVCQSRGGIFASFDRKAVNYCKRNAIPTLTLSDILAALWRGKFASKDEVREMIRQLEAGGRPLRTKAEILKE